MPTAPTTSRDESLLAGKWPATVRLLTTLLTRGPMTRTELGARTGLSAGAVTKALQPLLAGELIRELPDQWTSSGAGRPAVPLEVAAEHTHLVGIKITADEAIGVLTDLRAQVRRTKHMALPSIIDPHAHTHNVDPDDAIAATAQLIGELAADYDVSGVGVAVTGDVDARNGVVRFAPLLGWRGISLADRLTALTGLPTSVENDVRALTIDEQWFGAGLECASFALVTVGTGVGCGLVVDGTLLTGSQGVAAELGHLPIDRNGPECHCGGTGCVEALIGEAALLDRLNAAGDDVRGVYADVGRVLGLALASVANLIGPERIVLTGEAVASYDLFRDPMLSAFEAQCFGAAQRCELVVRPLQFEHWARGAAAVALAQLIPRV
jgi:predicted NBD/HSP70 family sugar kinase